GKVEYYEWKLVGEQTILAPLLQPYPFPSKSVSPTRQLIDTPYMAAGYEVPNAKGAPWWIQQNLVFVPRPVWIVEGQSSDPYYNFGKVIMYFERRCTASTGSRCTTAPASTSTPPCAATTSSSTTRPSRPSSRTWWWA